MSNFAIAGSSGYIGQLLSKRLELYNDCKKVVGIDIKAPKFTSPKFRFYKIDIRDRNIGEIFEREKVDTLIHLAFVFNPTHNIKEMYDINVNGAANILKNAAKYNTKRIFMFSSTTAYGAHRDNPELLTEESPLRGNSDFCYSSDKVEVEKLCEDFRKEFRGITFTNIRPCIIFGPNVDNHISRYISKVIVPLVAGYNPKFQFIHEDDLLDACMLLFEKNASSTFNIVGNESILVNEIPRVVKRRLLELPFLLFYTLHELMWQLRIPIVETPASMSSFIMYPWIASGEKAYRDLGFLAKYSSKETLMDFYNNRLAEK